MASKLFTALGASLLLALSAAAQEADDDAATETDKPWDVAAPPLATRDVPIDVAEGTWMSLDVSPDGTTIAFDLLGDIYTLPIAGGEATAISIGIPWEIQPRFSPDGSLIAFTSDRGGGDNIWIMSADGSERRQLTDESFRLLNNPTWSPDGRYIAARKHFTTERSLGTGEIWLYHLGGGDGVALVERPNEDQQKELGEPAFSPDGRYIYYSLNSTPGNTFIYAQDSNGELFQIRRYDMQTGEIETAVSGAGGAVRPTPSPDGRHLAYVKRERARSMLYVKDLASGEERRLYGPLDQDMQETWGVHGMYPNMDWTPNSQSIVFWSGGGLHRISIVDGAVTDIPFHVADTRAVVDPVRPQTEVAPDAFRTTMPRFAEVAPDGSRVVFESVGKLYVKSTAGGEARRLTRDSSDRRELFPSWSRDGRRIVFATWDDQDLGAIRVIAPDGSGERAVTGEPGHYRRPRFSPDGATIVLERGTGGYLTSPTWSERPGVYRIPAAGGEMTRVTTYGRHPHFAAAGDRIFMTAPGEEGAKLVSVDLNGEAQREHASGELVVEYQVSPAGDHLAFRENFEAYVTPMTPGPQAVGTGAGGSALPVIEASGDGALYAHWSHDGAQLNWSLGPTLYAARLDDMMPDLPPVADEAGDEEADGQEAEDEGYEPPTEGLDLSITLEADRPEGVVALVGARVVTMAADDGGVIEDAAIVIDGDRIASIGPRADVTIPPDARVVDVAGRTIIPGLIDAHAHGPQGEDDIVPQQNWSAIGHLALGVTTIHDPSSEANHIFAAAELQRVGDLLSPRIFSTGDVVYGARAPGNFAAIDSLDDAREHVRRLRAQGAYSIKNYNQPRRDQRQQVVAAAQEEGLLVVPEGASLFHMDMSLIADGNASLEHNIPQSMLYEDVLSFFAATRVAYTPTLVVTYGGLAADPYWRMVDDVWLHPILSRHVPPHILQPSTVRRTKAPEEDFVDQVNANTARLLADRGVPVSIGGHGQEEGLGAHWEMWSFVRGGMTPLQALRAATAAPAAHLGFDRDLGSLEPGKLADLVVLEADPLTDIRNTDDVEMVMLGGRLYNAETMSEVGGEERPGYYWE